MFARGGKYSWPRSATPRPHLRVDSPLVAEASPDGARPASAAPAAHPSTARALWRLTRPRFAFWLLWIPFIGYGFALWDRALDWTNLEALLLVLLAWLALNAGTMWLNAALDRRERGSLFARPAPIPQHIVGDGYTALGLAVLLSVLANLYAGLCAVACAALAVLYSHPATAWKGHPVAGPVTNAVGYGLLSGLAGWVLVGVAMNVRTALTLALMSLWLLGATFAAQAFQREDDLRRGYRTLVVTHGPAACLRAARICMNAAVGAVLLLAIWGYYPRLCLLATPVFVLADRFMQQWMRQPEGGGPRWAAGLIQRMLLGGIAIFALAYTDYLYAHHTGGEVAGLGTVVGRPAAAREP
jgi:4-hydroxybenzoate polyprenyltransferase